MKILLGCLLVLSLALPVRADLGLQSDGAASADSLWSRAFTAAHSAPPSPIASNAVHYKSRPAEKQVPLKAVNLDTVKSLRLLTHANIPLKVLMACTAKTRDEVQGMFDVVKQVNEEEKLPADERIKLHLICDTEASFRAIEVSQPEFDSYMEVDRYFHTTNSDIWMQDWGEIAMVDLPDQKKQQLFILDTNRGRADLAELPATLAREWNANYFQKPTVNRQTCGDYGGNIEVTPDNVLILGNTSSEEMRGILAKGYKDRTALLDTSWLLVGHVDEYLSTVPTPKAPRGYVIVKADPRLGMQRIAKLSREQLTSELDQMVRTLFHTDGVRDNAAYWDRDQTGAQRGFGLLHAYHASVNGYALDGAAIGPDGAARVAEVAQFVADNEKIAATIDAQLAVLEDTIQKATGDSTPFTVVPVPAVFEPFERGKSVALLPGAANLLVLRNHVVVPDPLLPSLQADLKAAFAGVGIKAHMIPDASYHYWQGQLHCGTNVLRHPNKWLMDPARRPARVTRFQELHGPSGKN